MTPAERLTIIRMAREHLNQAYLLLLAVLTEREEEQLSRLVARLEDLMEAKGSEALRDRDQT